MKTQIIVIGYEQICGVFKVKLVMHSYGNINFFSSGPSFYFRPARCR